MNTPEDSELQGTQIELGRAPLFDGDPGPAVESLPPWLVDGPPKLQKQRWPGGAKSATWLSMIDLCPRKHSRTYRDRIKSPATVEMRVGTAVHFAYEAAAVRRIKGRYKGLPPTASVPELLHLVEFCEEARLDGEVLQRARELIEAYGPVDFGDAVQAETVLSFWVNPRLKLAGYVDLVLFKGDPEDPEEVTVRDWKSGESLPGQAELALDPQACLYVIAARKRWPRARRVVFELVNVRHKAKRWVPYSTRLERNFLAFVRTKMRTWDMEDRTAKVGSHCSWCHVSRDCGALETSLRNAKRLPLAGAMGDKPLEELISLYRQMSVISKLADERRKELGTLIDQQVPEEQKSYRTSHLQAIRKRDPVTVYNGTGELISELVAVTGVDSRDVIEDVTRGISSTKLRSWVKGLPDGLREQAERIVAERSSQSYGSSHIEVRAIKAQEAF